MNLDYIIILSAAAESIDGTFPDFLNGMYIGGQVRVNAAVKLIRDHPDNEFIVAGGYNEQNTGIAGTSKKVDDIVAFLEEASPKANIQTVYSLPCTHHNFVATFNYWKKNKLSPRRVGILTNDYHLPRALAFAKLDAQSILPVESIDFVPIVAEELVPSTSLTNTNAQLAYARRQEYEKTGLGKINSGLYTDYCLTRDFDNLKTLIYENSDLLTSQERKALSLP